MSAKYRNLECWEWISVVAEGATMDIVFKVFVFFSLFRGFSRFSVFILSRARAHEWWWWWWWRGDQESGVTNYLNGEYYRDKVPNVRADGVLVCVSVFVGRCARLKRFSGDGVRRLVRRRWPCYSRADYCLLRAWRVCARRPQRRRQWTAPSSLAPSDEDFTGLPAADPGGGGKL